MVHILLHIKSFIIIMHNTDYFGSSAWCSSTHFLFYSVTSACMKHLLQLRFIRILMAESVYFLNESGSAFSTKWSVHDEMEFISKVLILSKIYTEKFIQIFSQFYLLNTSFHQRKFNLTRLCKFCFFFCKFNDLWSIFHWCLQKEDCWIGYLMF